MFPAGEPRLSCRRGMFSGPPSALADLSDQSTPASSSINLCLNVLQHDSFLAHHQTSCSFHLWVEYGGSEAESKEIVFCPT